MLALILKNANNNVSIKQKITEFKKLKKRKLSWH